MNKFKKTKEKKLGTAGDYDVVRTTHTESKDGVKVRMMPPVVLDPNKKRP